MVSAGGLLSGCQRCGLDLEPVDRLDRQKPQRSTGQRLQVVGKAGWARDGLGSVEIPRFLGADVGSTGANFRVAETGSSIIVTNEGNGDLTQALPRVHVVVTSIEKLVPTLEDAATLLRLLGAFGHRSGVLRAT